MGELNNVLLGVASSTANLQLPDPVLRDFYQYEEERVYWLDDQIDDTTLDLVKFIIK